MKPTPPRAIPLVQADLFDAATAPAPLTRLQQRHDDLAEKLPLARALRRKLKSGRSKADLAHLSLVHEPVNWLTFADHP